MAQVIEELTARAVSLGDELGNARLDLGAAQTREREARDEVDDLAREHNEMRMQVK